VDPSERVLQLMKEVLRNGEFRTAEAGRMIAERMRTEFPREHAAYLDQQADRLYTERLGDLNRSYRGQEVASRAPRRFQAAGTDLESLSVFVTWRCRVDAEDTQRSIGEMTGADHRFVAAGYEQRATVNQMLAAFHVAVAKKVGGHRTSEVFSEEELLHLYASITGEKVSPAA